MLAKIISEPHIAYWPDVLFVLLAFQPNIYVGPLQVVQLTGMKYYPTPSMPADVYVGRSKHCSQQHEILPHF